jgi:antitoxin component YwqK of YwqJK toxin-antitoxin module
MFLPDGGRLEGTFVDGVLDGTATYWYPGGKSGLKGTWRDGEMAAAR